MIINFRTFELINAHRFQDAFGELAVLNPNRTPDECAEALGTLIDMAGIDCPA